jgi:hypothetical protein
VVKTCPTKIQFYPNLSNFIQIYPILSKFIQLYLVQSNCIQFDPMWTNFLTPFSECFTCVACGKDLSHDEFVLDEQKTIYCTEDWAKKKAYRCVTCKRAIVPTEGQTKAPRLRALGKDYHPDCFKCEVCTYIRYHSNIFCANLAWNQVLA